MPLSESWRELIFCWRCTGYLGSTKGWGRSDLRVTRGGNRTETSTSPYHLGRARLEQGNY
jgi:hypothetical protein